MRTTRFAAAVVGLAALLTVAVGGPASAATTNVSEVDFDFVPATVTINVGDTVLWTNNANDVHTTTSDTGIWDSGTMNPGATFSHIFNSAGTFAYHCAIHSFMHGTIVVQAVSTPTPQPTPPPTPLPTPVRTAPPTIAVTVPPTLGPTDEPTAAPTATASPTTAAVETLVAASQSPVAVQVTPPPTSSGALNPILIGAAALAVVALGAIAFFVARRS